MLIRVAESVDSEVVVALRHAALSAGARGAYSAQEVVELLADLDADELHAMIEDRRLFVAETDGVIVGCAGWRGTHLRHVYVDAGLQRLGVGTRLVARAESDLRDRTSAAVIHVASVLYARGFYEQLGYQLATNERSGSEPFWMKKTFVVTQ